MYRTEGCVLRKVVSQQSGRPLVYEVHPQYTTAEEIRRYGRLLATNDRTLGWVNKAGEKYLVSDWKLWAELPFTE